MTQQNIEFKAIPGQFNIDEAQGMVECFVAGIGNKDSVGDVLVSGAFSKSLQRRKPRVVWGHNWNDPIGKVLEIYEVAPGDRRLPAKMLNAGIGGLYARVQFNLNSEKGREAFANVAFFGQEQEWSIGYKTLDSIFDPNLQANILKEVELYEVSPVLHGANQLTGTISVKSDDSTMVDEAKGGIMIGMGGPMAGRPTGMMPHRHHRPTPNILETNKPGIGDERKNQLEIELAVRAGAPVKVRLAEENTVIFDRMTPDGAPTTYRVAYHFTGKEFMFGKPEKVSVQTVYVPSSEESGSRVVIPSQMPSMPMQVKPQGNAYLGDDSSEVGMIMPKSYEDNGEKWVFDDEMADLANILSDTLDFKVGRTLSAKNMSKLKAILESLQDVVASADKEVQEKTDYIIPVPIENAFQTKQLLDPIFDYHRVESHVTEEGIVVTSGVTSEFIDAIGVAEKALGQRLGGGLGKLGRAARGAANFDPNAWDGDGDGLVQEGTPFQRPAIPGVNDRSTGGRVDAAAATRAFERQGGLASSGKRPQPAEWQIPATEKNNQGISVIDSQILTERMAGLSLADTAKKFGLTEQAVRQRELREMRRLREFAGDPNEEILAYRLMGMSLDDAADIFGKPREEIRKIEMAQLKKLRDEKDDDFILALRERGVSLGQVAKATGLKDTEVRKREQIARNNRPEVPIPDKPGTGERREGLASAAPDDDDQAFERLREEQRGIDDQILELADSLEDSDYGPKIEAIAKEFNISYDEANRRYKKAEERRKRTAEFRNKIRNQREGLASSSDNFDVNDRIQREKKIVELYNEGLTAGQISEYLLSQNTDDARVASIANIRSVIDKNRKNGKVPFRSTNPNKITEAQRKRHKEILDLFNNTNLTQKEIAQLTGTNTVVVSNVVRKNRNSDKPSTTRGDKRRGLASTSEIATRDREVLKGEIVSGPGAVTPASKQIDSMVNRGFIKDTHGDLLNEILADLTPENMESDDAGKILSNIRKQLLQSIKDGKFDDFKDAKLSERTLRDYLENNVIEAVLDSLFETMNQTEDIKFAENKARREIAEDLRDELVNEWGDSLRGLAKNIQRSRPPSKEEIAYAKERARSELADLIDDLDEGVIDRDTADFWAKVDDILMLDPTIDTAEMIVDLERAARSGKDTNPDNQNVVGIFDELDGYEANPQKLKVFIRNELDDAKLNSRFLPERVRARERLSGGLASQSSIVRPTGIQRDERGNVDATDARKMREDRDKAIFTKLRDLGLSDEEIESLTGVKNGGREISQEDLDELNKVMEEDIAEGLQTGEITGVISQEEAKKILEENQGFIRGNVGRRGMASQSTSSGKLRTDSFLQRPVRAADGQNGVPDNDIMIDFISGMTPKEISDARNLGGEKFAQKAIRRELARIDRNEVSTANPDMDIAMYRAAGLSVRDTAALFQISPREVRKREKKIKNSLGKELDDDDLLYLRSGLTLEKAGAFLGVQPSKLRQMEQAALRRREESRGRAGRGGLASSSGEVGFNKIIKPDRRVMNSAIRTLEDNKEYIEDRMMSGRNRNVFDGAWVDQTIENLKKGEITYQDGLDIMDVLMDIVNDRIRKDPSARTATEGDVYQYQKLGRRLRKAMLNGLTDEDLETIRVEQGIAPRRSGLASSSGGKTREMDMTLEEYAKLNEVLKKYLDDSQVDGIGSDEDMKNLQDIIEKIGESSDANDAIQLTDSEIDDYIDTLTRMNNNGPVEEGADKNQIQGLIDSLNKTKRSTDGTYESDALQQAGTRLSPAKEGARRVGKQIRAFRSSSGTINPHKKLDIELNENEIGLLREEISNLLRSAENPNILRGVAEKLEKANNGKFTIEADEYEDIVKSIEQSKSKGGVITSDLLGVIEQAAETNDGKYSSANMRSGGLASNNGGKKPNNGAPPDITEAMQKEYIFWAKSGKANNLRLVQEAVREFDANDGQLSPSMWKRLRTMYENMGPGSSRGGRRGITGQNSGTGRRSRSGLASSSEDYTPRGKPGVPGAMRPADFEVRGEGEVGRGANMGSGLKDQKFTGLSLDEAKPENWDELSNEEKFDWLMYEGNPSKVADTNQRMSQAAHEGAIKKVLQDMEREERRSMTPEERRAERDASREERRRDLSEAEAERQAAARKKREAAALKEQGPKKTYKPKKDAKEAKIDRQDTLQDYQDIITDTQRKLEQALEKAIEDGEDENDFSPSAEDIWETVYALLGDEDMTKKSINDAIEALDEYINSNSPGENTYEKLSIKQAKGLLGKLGKTQDKYSNDPWIVDDLPRSGGLASRRDDGDRPRPGSREMPQSNAKRENEMKKVIDLAQQVLDDMKSRQDADKGKRARTGLASSSKPKAMITDEATFFKDIESSLQKEIRNAQKAGKQDAVKGLTKLQEVIARNEASKTGSRRTNVGSIYLTDDEADLVMEGLMFALDNQIEKGGDKRIEWYTKLLEKIAKEAMSTFIDKKF